MPIATQSSSWYLTQITNIEIQIANETKLAGVQETSDGNSTVQFDNRILALKNLKTDYETLYEIALNKESGNDNANIAYLPRREFGY